MLLFQRTAAFARLPKRRRINLAVPADLAKWLEQQAKEEHRSLTDLIVNELQKIRNTRE